MKTRKDLTGQKFNNLTVIKAVGCYKNGRYKNGATKWLCRCVCGKETTSNSTNLEKNIIKGCSRHRSKRVRPFETLYNRLLSNAKRRQIPVRLTYEEFLTFTVETECHYCRTSISWAPFVVNGSLAYHLDRTVSEKGYTIGNCVVCCTRCNRSKSNTYSYLEWYGMTEVFRSGKLQPFTEFVK